MRFRDDNRAVTVQVGAILLFATIVIALAMYQATVVPSQNADVEYKHSQTVQNQLADVRNAVLRTAASGNTQPVSVTLGTQYPSRAFLMNPPPATGTLRTGAYEDGTVLVSNVNATNNETRDFLDGSWSASTKYLAYAPNYHEYDDAPNLRYETSVLSNYYPDADGGTVIPLTDQLLVDNETKTVTLVTLNGSLSTTSAGSVSVTPETLSAPYQRVQVRPAEDGEPVNVSVPTRIPADRLAERTDLGDHPGVVDVRNDTSRPNAVNVTVEWSEPFTLQTARVGVGTGTENPEPHYLTLVENRGDRVTVEARDRFNNAESGVTVTATNTTIFPRSPIVTGVNGRATFEVATEGNWSSDLEILNGDRPMERVSVSGVTGSDDTDNGDSDTQAINWRVVDNSRNSNADYRVEYDVNATNSDFSYVTVTYDNQANNWGDGTSGQITDPRSTHTFSEGGTMNDDYEITLRAYDSNGSVIASRTLTDPADGTNPTSDDQISQMREPNSPSLGSVSVTDRSQNTKTILDVAYGITGGQTTYQETRVTFLNTNDGNSGTETSTSRDTFVTYNEGGDMGDTYEITTDVVDDDGITVDRNVTTEVADGTNDADGQTDPTLQSSAITDNSDTSGNNNNRRARYNVSYSVSDSDNHFERVEVEFSNPQDSETFTSQQLSDTVTYVGPQGSASNQASDYTITIYVYDGDSNIVDSSSVTDSPDGTGP